jgi:hypothetical protein
MSVFVGITNNPSPSTTDLVDTQMDFLAMGVGIGTFVENLSDGSTAELSAIIDENTLFLTPLSGGLTNLWKNGDQYKITTSAEGELELEIPIIFSTQAVFKFCCRVAVMGREGRARLHQTQRYGLVAQYRNAYPPFERDSAHGLAIEGADPFVQRDDAYSYRRDIDKEVKGTFNPGLLYGPIKQIKVLYIRPRTETSVTKIGVILEGECVMGVPLLANFRRGDLIKVMNRIWEVKDTPELEFHANREIIGYRLNCVLASPKTRSW